MKCAIVTNRVEFKPIKLELTFETEAEINNFWHRMYLSDADVYRKTNHDKTFFNAGDAIEIYEEVDKIYSPSEATIEEANEDE